MPHQPCRDSRAGPAFRYNNTPRGTWPRAVLAPSSPVQHCQQHCSKKSARHAWTRMQHPASTLISVGKAAMHCSTVAESVQE